MLRSRVQQHVENALAAALPEIGANEFEIQIELPQDPSHGHYSCNIAMHLARTLKKNPLEIAKAIAAHVETGTIVDKAEVAAPGFLNFWITPAYLTEYIEGFTIQAPPKKKETIIVEYSSPNIAKEMHIGHLRNTVFGEAMKRILRFLGYHVIADNHLGDYGTQFGKLIYALKNYGDKAVVEQAPIKELQKLYVEFHDRVEKDETLEDLARAESKKLEDGDKENVELWKWICEVSLQDFQHIYDLLDVEFDTQLGESFYSDMLPGVIKEMLDKHIAVQNEDGSVAVVFEDHGMELPSMPIQRSDGGTLYVTRDIATLKYRHDEYKPYKVIYVVGAEQELYFRQVFAIASLMEWDDVRYFHMSYGMFRLKEGKMSTRKGTSITAMDVISEGRERVEALLKEREVDKDLAKTLVDTIALGAIKYSDLSQNRNTPQTFDWEKILAFSGNSAPYLQYTYARSKSILRNAKERDLDTILEEKSNYTYALSEELELAIKIAEFYGAVDRAGELCQPNILAGYLFELASLFNGYYNKVQILGDEEEKIKARLRLVEVVGTILQEGLGLLAIEAPERM